MKDSLQGPQHGQKSCREDQMRRDDLYMVFKITSVGLKARAVLLVEGKHSVLLSSGALSVGKQCLLLNYIDPMTSEFWLQLSPSLSP
ncbi:unnamed protein product [Caretta caretta]